LFLIIIILGIVLYILLKNNGEKSKNQIFASGTIEITEVEISTKVAGRIEKLLVDEGDSVIKDQVLIELDYEELQAKLKQAEAALRVSLAQLSQAKSSLANLKDNLDRINELYQAGSATQQQLDDLRTKYQVAQEQLNLSKNLVEQNSASIDLIKIQTDNSIIKSPINGLVLSKNTETGEVVLPGISLLTVGDLARPWVKIYIMETDLGRVKFGQKAEVRVDAYPDKVFEGKITYISSQAEFTPKNIQTKEERVKLVFGIKVSLENPLQILKPGMPADVTLLKD
ncbi:MAG: efflux RND transporter periplasmic adaptor subunit, partial [candidate division Zixibacteria bacterium]|nr:efflux RND transporter periplasmic adaptor subunit [candidate division Zixibacteria bacterium]